MSRQETPEFGLGKSILYSAILITLFLGVAELAVRGWAHYLREDAERWDPATGTFVLVPGEHRSGRDVARINSDGFVGAELQEPGPDLFRIVAVGDSCTYGGGNETDTYPAILQGLLKDGGRPGLRYEVVNAGISGLNSELALRRLESRVLELEPDLVTIYVGWNDLMKFDPLGQSDTARWSGVARLLDRLWLVKGLRKLIFFHVRPRLRPPRTGPESHSGRFADFRPSFYEDNVRAMVARVREQGGQPVLVTLPTVVRTEMSPADLRRAGVVFPYFPSAYGSGDLLDLVDAYNRSLRRLAVEEQLPLLDLARHFEGFPDPRPYFWDTMHPSEAGREVVARFLHAELERQGLLEEAP